MVEARLPLYAPRGPSLARATALSGAATVNLLVLGALLLPATLAPTLTGPRLSDVEPALIATVVEVASVVLPSPPPPAPVERAAPVRPAPAPVAVPVPVPETVAPPTPGTTPVEAPAAATTSPAPVTADPSGVAPGGAVEGTLAYIEAPHPAYPQRALRQRAEGVVLLRVRVGSDGLPLAVDLARSSGHPALDDAARRQVLRHWRFQPAIRDGRAVEAIGLVPVAFRLDLR